MKLPFFWISIGFSFGIITEKFWNIPFLWLSGGLFAGILILWFLRRTRFFLIFFVCLVALSGVLWARLDAATPANAVQNFARSERVSLGGVVDSLPEVKTRGKRKMVSFVLSARTIAIRENRRSKLFRVRGNVQVCLLQSSWVPQVGDTVRIFGELGTPKQVLNPGEFDYGSFLAQKNIRAVMQAIGGKSVRRVREGPRFLPARLLAESRRVLASWIDKLYAAPEAAILKALVLGLRTDVAPEVRSQFMKTGTIHLLAISGLNITMIAGSFYLMFLFLGLSYRKTAFLTIWIVILYVGLAGAGIPVQRAGYGSLLVLLGVLLGRRANLLNVLCFAFFVLLVGNPQSLGNIGFQLSFLSVLSLILVLPLLSRFSGWALSLGSSLAVLLGTFPIVLYYFNIFSPISIVANLAAIPLFDAALLSTLFTLVFCGVPFLNFFLVKISSWILGLGLLWVKYLSTCRAGYWFLERPSLGLLAAYYASFAMILFVHKKSFPGKRFLMPGLITCWMCFSVLFFIKPGAKQFELTLLAGGRNQIANVHFSNEVDWLFNAGRNFPSDQGEWLIAPFLRHRGVRRLEGILFFDPSKTNTGGLPSVLRDFSVRYLLCPATPLNASDEFQKSLLRLGRKSRNYQPGDEIVMGKEKIQIMAASNKGIALMIRSGPWRLLLISQWDPVLFGELLWKHESMEQVHAVFLPALKNEIPDEFQDWFGRVRPLLAVCPVPQRELTAHLDIYGVPCLTLNDTGALCLRQNGPRLELVSFLKGPLGFFSYS